MSSGLPRSPILIGRHPPMPSPWISLTEVDALKSYVRRPEPLSLSRKRATVYVRSRQATTSPSARLDRDSKQHERGCSTTSHATTQTPLTPQLSINQAHATQGLVTTHLLGFSSSKAKPFPNTLRASLGRNSSETLSRHRGSPLNPC
jgi:hypothetical protein